MLSSHLNEFWRIKVDAPEWKKLLHLAYQKKYAKGDVIFFEGQKVEQLCYLEKGAVRIIRISPDGVEKILMHVAENTLFGEAPFFTEQPLLSSFICQSDAVVWFFSKECVHNELLPNHPEITKDIIKTLAAKLSALSNQSATLGLDSLYSKICKFIHLRYLENGAQDPIVDLGSIKMKDIASILGVHRITLYKAFKELENKGIIEQLNTKQLKILDFERLTTLRHM
jgi:CRP-like cAMP-binding protein